MSTRIESLGPGRRISPWIVLGTVAALLVALTVLTYPGSETATTPRAPVVAATSNATSEVAEIAAVKSAFAAQLWADRFGVDRAGPARSEERVIKLALKAHIARELGEGLPPSGGGG
jgi:hypothetical protein